jgi:hypothetical protein
MSQSLSPRRLTCEQLEDRLTPTWGTPWFDGTSLSLSFVPDGTNVSGTPSNLNTLLNATGDPSRAVREILRAYQTWAVAANLNVGLVGDGGQPMGVAGAPQEDIRFGDIRVGARPLTSGPTNALAGAVGFDYDSKTWAGDLVFNSSYPFVLGATSPDQNDLFSVALHEAGHSFGVADNTDPTSVMYAAYSGVEAGLSAADVQALQAMYGPRVNDAFEGAAGNETTATAYDLTANGNRTAVAADITRLGDVDVYKFTTPGVLSGVTGLTVNLKAAGVSLLTAKVSVLNAAGSVVASAVTTDPTNNNLSVTVPNYQAGAAYYVKVQGAGTDVFSVGAYVLKLNYSPFNPAGTNGTATDRYNVNAETWSGHGTPATAQTLNPVQTAKANTFVVAGALASPTTADWYRITPTAPTPFTGTLFVGTMTTTNGLLPAITVYNGSGQQLPAQVIQNDGGSFEVQLPGATTGTTYLIRVAAADPNGAWDTGFYTLGATLAPVSPTAFDSLTTNSATAATTTYTTLSVTGDQLTQFALTASGGSTTAATAVRVTVFDATGHTVFTSVTLAGRPLSTGTVWLASGTYTVAFTTATANGSAVGAVTYNLSSRQLSDPEDPYLADPDAAPVTDDLVVAADYSVAPPADAVIVDAIVDPFADPTISISTDVLL